jgi:hypothetical protein
MPIQNTKRVEHVRLITTTVAFNLLSRTRKYRLQAVDEAILLDVAISFNTRCEPLVKGPALELLYPNNVRIGLVYRDGNADKELDLTDQILNKMRSFIDSANQSTIRDQLERGMRESLGALHRVWGETEQRKADAKERMQARLSASSPSHLLTAFGERTPETLGGVLAFSNFLYDYVQIPAVSLQELIANESLTFQQMENPVIMVSHGVSDVTPIGGEVDLALECTYHNELVDEFDDLEHKIKARLLEIHETLSSDGPIIQGIIETKDSIMRFQRQLNAFGDKLQDQNMLVNSLLRAEASLEQKWDELQRAQRSERVLP